MKITEINGRVTRLESDVENNKTDILEIKDKMDLMATKDDVENLKQVILSRDDTYTKNMWIVIYGLMGVVAAIALAAFGIEKLPTIF